mgnify:CR=1 FL=1
MLVGIFVGILSAIEQYTFIDHAVTLVAFFGVGMPSFLVALIVRGVAFEYRSKRSEGAWRARWDAALARGSDHALKIRGLSQAALNLTSFLQQGAQVALVVWGVFLIRDGALSMGALIAGVILTGRCLGPLAQIAQTLARVVGYSVNVEFVVNEHESGTSDQAGAQEETARPAGAASGRLPRSPAVSQQAHLRQPAGPVSRSPAPAWPTSCLPAACRPRRGSRCSAPARCCPDHP